MLTAVLIMADEFFVYGQGIVLEGLLALFSSRFSVVMLVARNRPVNRAKREMAEQHY